MPTRRRVYYKFLKNNFFNVDTHFFDWLYQKKAFPPTPNELEQLYLEDEERVQRSIEWDRQEEAKQIAFKRKQKLIQGDDELLLLETLNSNEDSNTIDDFTPVPWKAVAKTRNELKKYHPPQEITEYFQEVEKGIIEEHSNYQKVIQNMGKDFDKAAHTDMLQKVYGVRNQYEIMQQYSYLFNNLDKTKPADMSDIPKEPPVYVDSYVQKNRERIMKEKQKRQRLV